jgi:hypothetical protein
LTTELEVPELAAVELAPEEPFGVGGTLPEKTGEFVHKPQEKGLLWRQ